MRSDKRFLVVTATERLWHVVNAIGIVLLALSGFNIHFAGSFNVMGSLETAVRAHNIIGVIVAVSWILWILYQINTKRFRFFLPNKDDMPSGIVKQVIYYVVGLFADENPPFPTTPERKFNPAQKWTYIAVMFGLMPVVVITGGYMLFAVSHVIHLGGSLMYYLSLIHTAVAFLISAFFIVHIYLSTTGKTVTSHFRQIITGYHEEH